MRFVPKVRLGLGWLCLVVVLGWISPVQAGVLEMLFSNDVEVMAVTYVTPAGRLCPLPSKDTPIYYMIVDLGERSFGSSWAGERGPPHLVALRWMERAMAEQGYLLADPQHPPTQLFLFFWGMKRGGHDALAFLGGRNAGLISDDEIIGSVLPSIYEMGLRGQMQTIARRNVFVGAVKSYTIDSLQKGNPGTVLWETHFGCPASGLWLKDALPLMAKAAAPYFGRETAMPVIVNATRKYGERVELGEMQVLGTVPSGDKSDPWERGNERR